MARRWQWLEEDYHRKVHSATNMCPLDLFMSQASSVRMVTEPKLLDSLFWKREYRKVRHDATLTLLNNLFEVPAHLVRQKVEIRYDPAETSIVHIYENDKPIFTAKAVSLSDNAHVKRRRKDVESSTIDFKSLLGCRQEER